jgi:putative membrane protein
MQDPEPATNPGPWWRHLLAPRLEDIGRHPDYRFTLANERTFLAWIRTALALVAGGIAIVQLVPEFSVRGGRHIIGVLLIGLAVVVTASSYLRWLRNEIAMRLDRPLPFSRVPWLVASTVVLVTVLALIFVIFSGGNAK